MEHSLFSLSILPYVPCTRVSPVCLFKTDTDTFPCSHISSSTANSVAKALTAQSSTCGKTMTPLYLRHSQQIGAISMVRAKKSYQSKASIQRSWQVGGIFDIQYAEPGELDRRYSIRIQAKMFGSFMVIVKLSGPFFGVSSSMPFNISTWDLIPEDAAIMKAYSSGDARQVRDLLQFGRAGPRDVTHSNNTPLTVRCGPLNWGTGRLIIMQAAIRGGSEEIVQLLLREGADPNLPYGKYQA